MPSVLIPHHPALDPCSTNVRGLTLRYKQGDKAQGNVLQSTPLNVSMRRLEVAETLFHEYQLKRRHGSKCHDARNLEPRPLLPAEGERITTHEMTDQLLHWVSPVNDLEETITTYHL